MARDIPSRKILMAAWLPRRHLETPLSSTASSLPPASAPPPQPLHKEYSLGGNEIHEAVNCIQSHLAGEAGDGTRPSRIAYLNILPPEHN